MTSFKIFISYLKSYIRYFVFIFISILIILIVFYLYNINILYLLEATNYSLLLIVFFFVIFFIWDYSKYYKKIKYLINYEKIYSTHFNKLPKASSLEEEIYQNILQEIYAGKNNLQRAFDRKTKDILEYYTLWIHQIKIPISGIKLILENDDFINPKNISNELFKIEEYVEMVLIYLRLDSKNNDLVLKNYDLDNIIKTATKKYALMFIRSKISLEYSPLNTKILTDRKWFTYVLEQLMSNSIKYTKDGIVKIYLESENVLVLEDTGIGIMKYDLPQIFEKGYTGYNGRINKQSSGLGLYLCKNILNMLGHKINIESEVDIGTKVKIDFSTKELEND